MTQCVKRPNIRHGDHTRCPNESTWVYVYLRMPLCDRCANIMRAEMRSLGHDDAELIVLLEEFGGEVVDR